MLLIDDARFEDRRRAARGPLLPLSTSLAAELEPLFQRELYIPRDKALLSRAGGRCERDGTTLEFDPTRPDQHRCPTCGTEHRGELHHRAWVTWYQLWLAERSVHAALFHALRGEARHAVLARDILRGYADRYLTYPNRDNVLGPTRLFFSTYLESIWLLQICLAADLLEYAGDHATADLVRDRIVEPSSALIAGFDEGMSNRQAWNNAALLAAGLLRRDAQAVDARFHGKSGLHAQLTRGLLQDGSWYEGENYHQFAFRGLWYAVMLCEASGRTIPSDAINTFQRGFLAPFLTALPDFTLPSRKDSQYAVSLRQWRFAELAELGFARQPDPQLAGALARCYEPGHESRDTGRSRSTADAERNVSSSLLTRADLGWRALLHALPELPPLAATTLRSVNLRAQGSAIFRRADDVHVALDYGQSGRGHGHPDRLNLLLSHGTTRWLDDLGTGSYVDPSLHWYRSTLAHNAPLADGRSQRSGDGALLAHEERDELGWVKGQFRNGDVAFTRTVVVTRDYLVDELIWSAPRDVRVELPWHVDADAEAVAFVPSELDGGMGLEDGFSFVRDCRSTRLRANEPVRMRARRDGRLLRATMVADGDTTLFLARAPGQPPSALRPFYVMRASGRQGRFRAVIAWNAVVTATRFDDDSLTVECQQGERQVHRETETGWRVDFLDGGASQPRSVELAGQESGSATEAPEPAPARVELRRGARTRGWLSELDDRAREGMLVLNLSEANYRRSEEPWQDAGRPRATVALAASDGALTVLVEVHAPTQRFASADAENAFDNEHPDTMGAGVQLHVWTREGGREWMFVPEQGAGSDRVRVRPITGTGPSAAPEARWRSRDIGYEMRVEVPLPNPSATSREWADVDVVINEAVAGRERRRGQLVLKEARGEFVYLRGDREEPGRSMRLELVP